MLIFNELFEDTELIQEFQMRRYTVNRQKALNRTAGRQSINLAAKGLREQYRKCRERCLKIKERIQRSTKSRAMTAARRSLR